MANEKSTKKLEVTQTKSIIRRTNDQARRLKALGFGSSLHTGRTIIIKDCPNTRHLLAKVQHLVKWQEKNEA